MIETIRQILPVVAFGLSVTAFVSAWQCSHHATEHRPGIGVLRASDYDCTEKPTHIDGLGEGVDVECTLKKSAGSVST